MSGRAAIEVRAAGGVVLREIGGGVEILLVHRPKYDDWSFPKGKLDAGESFAEAALREVREETGLSCRLEDPLTAVSYLDARGRLKQVRYWLMAPVSGEVGSRPADREIDEGLWAPPAVAGELLTYPRDRELLAEALDIVDGRGAYDG